MSDRDTAPDPIDEAFRRAEALVEDAAARAARRARVLGAVAAQSDVTSRPAPTRSSRRIWRGGGALMAASVAGLALLVTLQQRHAGPIPSEPDVRPAPPPVTPRGIGAGTRALATEAPAAPSAARTASEGRPAASAAEATPRVLTPVAPPELLARTPPGTSDVPQIPPLPVPPVQQRIEVPPPVPPLPVPPVQQRIEVSPLGAAAGAGAVSGSPAPRAFPLGEPSASAGRAVTGAGTSTDAAARLGAAAFAGRLREVRSLLAEGVPVDAVDANGETALMKSIRGGRPAVAALLRARGASPDRENRAGETARELAAERQDPRLDAALGLDH